MHFYGNRSVNERILMTRRTGREGYAALLPAHQRHARAHRTRTSRICALSMLTIILFTGVVGAVNHWLATESGFILPQVSFYFLRFPKAGHVVLNMK